MISMQSLELGDAWLSRHMDLWGDISATYHALRLAIRLGVGEREALTAHENCLRALADTLRKDAP